MEQTSILAIDYQNSRNKTFQGKRKEIREFLNEGYDIKSEHDGHWVLVKPPIVNVTLSIDDVTKTFDMKEDVLKHYNRKRLNHNLVKKFKADVENKKIKISLDPSGTYSFA